MVTGALRQPSGQLDGERVHGDRSDDAPPFAVDEHLGTREIAPEAVRVADRHEPDPRRLLGHEPAVARALAFREQLHLGELAAPGEHRLEPVVDGIALERREAVEGNPTVRPEASAGQPERGCAVRDVRLELWQDGRRGVGAAGAPRTRDRRPPSRVAREPDLRRWIGQLERRRPIPVSTFRCRGTSAGKGGWATASSRSARRTRSRSSPKHGPMTRMRRPGRRREARRPLPPSRRTACSRPLRERRAPSAALWPRVGLDDRPEPRSFERQGDAEHCAHGPDRS